MSASTHRRPRFLRPIVALFCLALVAGIALQAPELHRFARAHGLGVEAKA